VNPVLLGISAGLACAFGVRRLALPPLVAAATVLVCAASLPLLVVTGVLFSEPLFLLALFAALLVAERAVDEGGWRWAFLAGLSSGALALVRSAGIALLPALLVSLVLSGQRLRLRAALVATAGAMAALAPWELWLASRAGTLPPSLKGSYGPYFDWVFALYRERGAGFALVIARENIVSIYRTLGIALFPFGARPIRPLLVALFLVVAGLGLVTASNRARTVAWFLAFYCAMVVVWPYAPDRFLWAVWPLVGLLAALGSVEAWRIGRASTSHTGVRASAALACAVGMFALGDHAAYSARGVSRQWNDVAARTNAAALIPLAAWISANTDARDVVACDGEPFVHLYTGRTVVPVHILSPDEYLAGTPVEQAAADLRALFLAHRPRYAVFTGGSEELAAAPLLNGANGSPQLEPLATLPGGGAAFRVHLP
jgi:4-amino-4-deoxy-L-arabinose transferase-like glycosyltransferase